MKVSEVLRRIAFKIGTLDDVTGRAINPIINNRTIIDELMSQLRQYANITKGIQDTFSFPLNTNVPFVQAPSLALRSEGYFYWYVYSNSTIFPGDMRGAADVYRYFKYNPISGITNWIMPWQAGSNGQFFSVFPMKNAGAKTTTLTSGINHLVTTIPVASTAGYVRNHGRITIDNEKILYGRLDATNFYDCIRGVEMTTPLLHTSTTTVYENNLIMFYSRLPVPIIVYDDNVVEESVLNQELEPCEEHMEGIIKITSYNLLVKLDPTRAAIYKIDGEEKYIEYTKDIRRGYWRGRQGTEVRSPYPGNEDGTPMGPNFVGY